MRLGVHMGIPGGMRDWSPTDISGCVLWLRADMGIALNGSNVSAWADQSGNGNDVSQSTAAYQPAYDSSGGPNGTPRLTFDGVDDVLTRSPLGLPVDDYTMAGVVQTTTLSVVINCWVWEGAGGDGMVAYINNGALRRLTHSNVGTSDDGSATTGLERWVVRYDGTAKMRINGTDQSMGALANALTPTGGFGVGGRYNGVRYWTGHISEIVIYSRALTDSETSALDSYFAGRYA